MGLAQLAYTAVLHRHPDVAGIVDRIFVVGIDDVADLGSERQDARVPGLLVGKLVEPGVAVEEADGHAERHRELGGIARRRPVLAGEGLPQPVDQPFAGLAFDIGDVVGIDALGRQADGAVDEGVDHGAAGVRLEGDPFHQPLLPQTLGEGAVIRRRRRREGAEVVVAALEHGARPVVSGPGEERRAQPRMRRPAGMEPLGPGAVGEIFEYARRQR